MEPTRRTLLSGSAALLAMAALPNSAFAGPFYWRRYGGAPFASREAEAFADLPRVFALLGIPKRYRAELERLVRAHPKGLRRDQLKNGDRLEAMLSKGGVVHRDTIVAFGDVMQGKMGPPSAYTYEWDFAGGTLILPLICFNWCWRKECGSCSCYVIPMDYSILPVSGMAKVDWDAEHQARVTVHIDATEDELEAAFNEACFSVRDGDGVRKPFPRCHWCTKDGKIYPPSYIATSVGLPPEEPKGILSFYLKDGVGELWLPKAFAARWMYFCVDTDPYPVTAGGGALAWSRFDIVTSDDVERTLPTGRLDRTLSGAKTF